MSQQGGMAKHKGNLMPNFKYPPIQPDTALRT